MRSIRPFNWPFRSTTYQPVTISISCAAGSIPDATGAEVPIWFQVDSGSFAGGLARTASPPFPGVGTSGMYVVVQSPRTEIGWVEGKITPSKPGELVTAISWMAEGTYSGLGSMVDASGSFNLAVSFGPQPLRITRIPPIGLPTVTETMVQVNPEAVVSFSTTVYNDPEISPDDLLPRITELELEIVEEGPRLTIDVENLLLGGSSLDDVRVVFAMPGQEPVEAELESSSTEDELIVIVPNTVVLGLSEILVIRTGTRACRIWAVLSPRKWTMPVDRRRCARVRPTCLRC